MELVLVLVSLKVKVCQNHLQEQFMGSPQSLLEAHTFGDGDSEPFRGPLH